MQFFGPKPPFFRVVRTRLNGIISPPYPEATLDNFGFPVGGRLAARRAVFRPPGRILAVFGGGRNSYISTPNFETYLTKLVGTIRVTKKMSHIDKGPSPGWNYGETAILQILHILASFLECKTAIFFKLFPKRQFTVYNAEIFFVTSYNPMAWVVKRAKLN